MIKLSCGFCFFSTCCSILLEQFDQITLNAEKGKIVSYSPPLEFLIQKSWSRGHKARGQGQEHQKISRPRSKDRPSRGQGQGLRTQTQVFSKKKRFSKNFFRQKRSSKIFFQAISAGGNQKNRSLQIFRKVSGVFRRNFNGSKIVLSSSRGQSNFRELDLQNQGQGLENVSSRTSLRPMLR